MGNDAELVFSYIRDNTDVSAPDNTKSIRMSTDGFCISVVSSQSQLEEFVHYTFAPNLSFKKKIESIVAVEKKQKVNYEHAVFKFYTHLNTQIPEEFYDREEEHKIIPLLTDKTEHYVSLAEKVESWNLYTISLWEAELVEEVQKAFPDFQLSTVMASLMKFVSKQEKETVVVFVENNNFTIIAANKKGLLGANTFSFTNETDFLYYCLAFLRKIFPKVDSLSLTLCGNIMEGSPLYRAVGKYFSSVTFVSQEDKDNFPLENYSRYCDLF